MRRLLKLLLIGITCIVLLVGLLLWQAPALLGPHTPLTPKPLTPDVAVNVAKRMRLVGLDLVLGRSATLTLSEDEFNRVLSQAVARNPTVTALEADLQAEQIRVTAHLVLPPNFSIPTLQGKAIEARFRTQPTVQDDRLILHVRELYLGVIPVPVGLFLGLASHATTPAEIDAAARTISVPIATLLESAGGGAYTHLPVAVQRVHVAPDTFEIQLHARQQQQPGL